MNEQLQPDLETNAFKSSKSTHKQITEAILLGLTNEETIVINGPSRAGKSTYVESSLKPSLVSRGISVESANCMQLVEQDVVEIIESSEDVLILDEPFRLSDSESFIKALEKRKSSRKRTILVNTTLEGATEKVAKINQLSSTEPIEFPLEMDLADAKNLVEQSTSRLSPQQQAQLLGLTTNPSLLRNMIRICEKQALSPIDSLVETIKEALVAGKLYFEPSLDLIKKRIHESLDIPLPVRQRKSTH